MTVPIKIGIAGLGRAGWGMHCRELQGREDLFTPGIWQAGKPGFVGKGDPAQVSRP